MKLEDINNKEYIKELTLNREKFNTAISKDFGLIYSKFKEFGFYPPIDFLESVGSVQAKLFLLENYHIKNKEKYELLFNARSGPLFDDGSKLVKENGWDLNCVDFYDYSFFDFPGIRGSVFNLPVILNKEEKKIKYLENCLIRYVMQSSDINANKTFFENTWKSVFVQTNSNQRNLIFKSKEVREIYNVSWLFLKNDIRFDITVDVLFDYWKHDFDLSQIKKLNNLDGRNIVDIVNRVKEINPNLSSNDVFEFLNEKAKLLVLNNDFFNDFSPKSLNYTDLNIFKYRNSDFRELSSVLKPKKLIIYDDVIELSDLMKIKQKNEHDNDKINDVIQREIVVLKRLSKSLINGNEIVKDLIVNDDFLLFVNLVNDLITSPKYDNGYYTGAVNDFIDVIITNIVNIENVSVKHLTGLNIPLGYFKSDSIKENKVHDVFNLNKFVLLNCHKNDQNLPDFYYEFCEKNPVLVKDFQNYMEAQEISMDSPLFKEPLFKVKTVNAEYLKNFNENTQKKLIDLYDIELRDNLFPTMSLSMSDILLLNKDNYSYNFFERVLKEKYKKIQITENSKEIFINQDLPIFFEKYNLFMKTFNDVVTTINNPSMEYEKIIVVDEKSKIFYDFHDLKHILKNKYYAYAYAYATEVNGAFESIVVDSLNNDPNKILAIASILNQDKSLQDFINLVVLKACNDNQLDNIPLNVLVKVFKPLNNKKTKTFFDEFNISDEMKMKIFKSVFKSNSVFSHTKNKTNNCFIGLTLEEMFPNKKQEIEALNHLIENVPSIVLSSDYKFCSYLNHPESDYKMLLNIFKDVDKDFGMFYPNWSYKNNMDLLSNALISESEENVLKAIDWVAENAPSIYSLILSKDVLSKLCETSLKNHFNEWLSNSGCNKNDIWNYACYLANPDDVVKSSCYVFKTYKKMLINGIIDEIAVNDLAIGSKDCHFFSSYISNNSIYPEKVNKFSSALLKEDLLFLKHLIKNESILPCVKDFNDIVKKSINTTEDVLKLLTFNITDTVKSNNKEVLLFSIHYASSNQTKNTYYQKVITELMREKNGFIETVNQLIKICNLDNDLSIPKLQNLSDIIQRKSYIINSIFNDFEVYGYNIKDLTEIIEKEKIINSVFNSDLPQSSNYKNDIDTNSFKI